MPRPRRTDPEDDDGWPEPTTRPRRSARTCWRPASSPGDRLLLQLMARLQQLEAAHARAAEGMRALRGDLLRLRRFNHFRLELAFEPPHEAPRGRKVMPCTEPFLDRLRELTGFPAPGRAPDGAPEGRVHVASVSMAMAHSHFVRADADEVVCAELRLAQPLCAADVREAAESALAGCRVLSCEGSSLPLEEAKAAFAAATYELVRSRAGAVDYAISTTYNGAYDSSSDDD